MLYKMDRQRFFWLPCYTPQQGCIGAAEAAFPKEDSPPLVTTQKDNVQLDSQYQAKGVASDTIILC